MPGRRLNQREIDAVQGLMIKICERLNMEFAVMVMQGPGPTEIFCVQSDEKWAGTTEEIRRRIKEFADESRADALN